VISVEVINLKPLNMKLALGRIKPTLARKKLGYYRLVGDEYEKVYQKGKGPLSPV